MVLPGSGQSFEQFRNDDVLCQQFAYSQVSGTTANQAAVNGGVTSYDVAYIQCMYAKGHQVPVSGQFSHVIPQQTLTRPAATHIPPPPPSQ